MVLLKATKLNLPNSSPQQITSLLFDPTSHSLALMHSDTSFSLFPSLSSLSSSTTTTTHHTLIPSPISSATFLRLHPHRLLFLTSSPLLSGSSILLRFHLLRSTLTSFYKPKIISHHTHLTFDEKKSGVVFNVNHGVSIKLVGSVNVFSMYSLSNSKIWVFAVKMVGNENDDDGVVLKLVKCAVIDCTLPVFSTSVSFGYLILGEMNGVRVFPLRPLVKGSSSRSSKVLVKKTKGGVSRILNLGNGVIRGIEGSEEFDGSLKGYANCGVGGGGGSKCTGGEGNVEVSSNGCLEEKVDKHCGSVKLRSVKLRQDSKEGGAFFVAFKSKEVESFKSTKVPMKLAKAVCVHALSPNNFLILSSDGDLHLLSLSNTVHASEIPCHMMQLTHTMKIQKLAVFSDISIRAQTFWISDGQHTIHMMAVSEPDACVGENDRKDTEDKPVQTSVIQAIFSSEKIQEVVPMAENAILLLGQGSMYAYAIS